MRVFKGFEELPSFESAVVTVGSFDGLHRGHLSLLESVVDLARESGGESVVLTFDIHPRIVLGLGDGLRLLTSVEEKIMVLDSIGIDNLVIIPFNRDFSRLSQEDFVRLYLVDKIGVKSLVMGYNHRLGRGNEGTHSELEALSRKCGFSVTKIEQWRSVEFDNVSSTTLRQLILNGDIERANSLLSRPFMILGRVDDARRVWVGEPLKIEPPAGRYEVLTNGVESAIEIYENGVVELSCDDILMTDVKIEVLRRIQ